MVVIRTDQGKFQLAWMSGAWRDKAGHIWTFNEEKETFSSPGHAIAYSGQWKVE